MKVGKVLIERVFRVLVEGATIEVGFGKLRPSYRGREGADNAAAVMQRVKLKPLKDEARLIVTAAKTCASLGA